MKREAVVYPGSQEVTKTNLYQNEEAGVLIWRQDNLIFILRKDTTLALTKEEFDQYLAALKEVERLIND